MAQEEKTGQRDMTYSNWHRQPNLPRHLSWVDIDACEYCEECKTPLALIELALDKGQAHKTATVTRNLAKMAGVPAYVSLYLLGEEMVQNGKLWHLEIVRFRMQQIAPIYSEFKIVTPQQYINFLEVLRKRHKCGQRKNISEPKPMNLKNVFEVSRGGQVSIILR